MKMMMGEEKNKARFLSTIMLLLSTTDKKYFCRTENLFLSRTLNKLSTDRG